MKARAFNQISFIDIVEYLFLIAIILNCNTIWTSYEESTLFRILKVIVVFATMLYFIAIKKISFSRINRILIFGIFGVTYILLYAIVVGYNISSFIYFVIDVLCIYAFVEIANEKRRGFILFGKYSDIILIIAVISLAFWLCGSVLGIIHPTGYVYSHWTGDGSLKIVPSYYNVYFEAQYIVDLVRNTAIFNEAPMYNINLCVALLVELFCRQKVSIIRCLILIATIMTTISTTGICMVIIVLLVKFIFSRSNSGIGKLIKTIVVPVLLVSGIIAVQFFMMNKLYTSSGEVRTDNFVAGYKALKKQPIFGAGFRNLDHIKHFML